MSAIERLRQETRAAHDRIDEAFGRYDLSKREDYVRFLHAHALALPAAEAALAAEPGLPLWRERRSLLIADLTALDRSPPPPLDFTLPAQTGAAWGALYVIEGSRLGGVMLSRNVPPTWPARYLGARHLPGEWRLLLAAVDATATDERWIMGALAGANATFDLYARAV